ncbi:MAG: hypothetical protein ACNS60_00990 [Candidatus Cyclobacteriaceae bacterium M2_1C_046]
MKYIHTYLKFILLAGAILLSGIDAGAAGKRRLEPQLTLKGDRDSLMISEKRDNVTENVFYVDDWIKDWFTLLDKNKDNKINKSEFMSSLELFEMKEQHLIVFETEKPNSNGTLNLKEFKSFIDTTNLFSKDKLTTVSASNADPVQSDNVDIIKLLAGAVAICLVMAAFRMM